jgi:ABC-type sugar transport system substrate-binding protein
MKPLQIMCLPAIAGLLLTITGCASPPLTIAAIPLVAPDQIWLDEHVGVLRAAAQEHVRVYWNAPDREGDVQRQISLVQQVEKAHYGGLILAPEQELALTLPVEQVLAAGMPVVIVHTPLALPPGGHLAYVVNDEEKTGELAAQIIGRALHGKGRLAITGVQPLHPSLMRRMRAFERALASDYPAITIAARIPNTRDDFASEENASALIQSPKKVDAIFALDVTAGSNPGDRRRQTARPGGVRTGPTAARRYSQRRYRSCSGRKFPDDGIQGDARDHAHAARPSCAGDGHGGTDPADADNSSQSRGPG